MGQNIKNVLLIDDDDICIFLTKRILEKDGLAQKVQTALNGQQGIDLLIRNLRDGLAMPDLILLDIMMPIMDGFEFLDAFKRLDFSGKENVKIIIVSSSINTSDFDTAREMGVDFIIKPLTTKKLKTIFQESNSNDATTRRQAV